MTAWHGIACRTHLQLLHLDPDRGEFDLEASELSISRLLLRAQDLQDMHACIRQHQAASGSIYHLLDSFEINLGIPSIECT